MAKKKKKISSQDFMNLLDEQENSTERIAFKPRKVTEAPKAKLGPVQKELLDLAIGFTPKFIADWAKSEAAQKWVDRIGVSVGEIKTAISRIGKTEGR
jgi:hypothetical protein